MATKKTKKQAVREEKVVVAKLAPVVDENQLDPQEEKILDWILKAVVAFVLGWLGLAIVMVIGGFFHLWG